MCHCCRESDSGLCLLGRAARRPAHLSRFKALPAQRIQRPSWWPQSIGVLGHPSRPPLRAKSTPSPVLLLGEHRGSQAGTHPNPATHTPLVSENSGLAQLVAAPRGARGGALGACAHTEVQGGRQYQLPLGLATLPGDGPSLFTGGETKTPRSELICPRPQSRYAGSGSQRGPSNPEPSFHEGPASWQDLSVKVPRTDRPPPCPGPIEVPHQPLGDSESISREAGFIQKVLGLRQGVQAPGPAGVQRHKPGERAHPPIRPALRPCLARPGTHPLPWPKHCPRGSGQEPSVTARGTQTAASRLTLVHSPQPPRSRHQGEGIRGSP